MDLAGSNSLFWRHGTSILHGKKTHRDRVNRLEKTGAVAEWVRQYVPQAEKQQKTKEEIRTDLEDRLTKLVQLITEDILQNDFERKIVKAEIQQLKLFLD